MQDVSAWTRVLLFLYSTRDLVGSGLAIGGLALFLPVPSSDWWFPIVAGLYALGWLAVPGSKELELKVRNEATQANLVDSLDEIGQPVKVALARRGGGTYLGPDSRAGNGTGTQAVFRRCGDGTCRDTGAGMRSPVTCPARSNYLRLPAAFASLHAIEDGKTRANNCCWSNWTFSMSNSPRSPPTSTRTMPEALVTNGWFLKEKFRTVSFCQPVVCCGHKSFFIKFRVIPRHSCRGGKRGCEASVALAAYLSRPFLLPVNNRIESPRCTTVQ